MDFQYKWFKFIMRKGAIISSYKNLILLAIIILFKGSVKRKYNEMTIVKE